MMNHTVLTVQHILLANYGSTCITKRGTGTVRKKSNKSWEGKQLMYLCSLQYCDQTQYIVRHLSGLILLLRSLKDTWQWCLNNADGSDILPSWSYLDSFFGSNKQIPNTCTKNKAPLLFLIRLQSALSYSKTSEDPIFRLGKITNIEALLICYVRSRFDDGIQSQPLTNSCWGMIIFDGS